MPEPQTTAQKLRTFSDAKRLAPELLATAQRVYDDWDETDTDTYAGGGICHLIAEAMANVLCEKAIDATTLSSSHEQHVFVALQVAEGVYTLDIPWSVYETGGGFSWQKLPNVTFEERHLVWFQVSRDPLDFESYCAD